MLNLGKVKYSFVLEYEQTVPSGQVLAFVHLQFLCQAKPSFGVLHVLSWKQYGDTIFQQPLTPGVCS